MKIDKVWYVNRYMCDKRFGGHEEGGWWYETGEFMHCAGFYTTLEEAVLETKRLAMLLPKPKYPKDSVLCEGVEEYHVSETPGSSYPEVVPHYE